MMTFKKGDRVIVRQPASFSTGVRGTIGDVAEFSRVVPVILDGETQEKGYPPSWLTHYQAVQSNVGGSYFTGLRTEAVVGEHVTGAPSALTGGSGGGSMVSDFQYGAVEQRRSTATQAAAEQADTSVASAKVGDIYVGPDDVLYRVAERIDEPVLSMVPVAPGTEKDWPMKFPKFGGVSNETWAGLKRIHRPSPKETR